MVILLNANKLETLFTLLVQTIWSPISRWGRGSKKYFEKVGGCLNLISDPQKWGIHITFLWMWIYLRPCERICVWVHIYFSKHQLFFESKEIKKFCFPHFVTYFAAEYPPPTPIQKRVVWISVCVLQRVAKSDRRKKRENKEESEDSGRRRKKERECVCRSQYISSHLMSMSEYYLNHQMNSFNIHRIPGRFFFQQQKLLFRHSTSPPITSGSQVVCSNREAWKRPARGYSRNGRWT